MYNLMYRIIPFQQFDTQNSLIRAKSIFKSECKWYDAITRWPPKRNKNGGTEMGIKKFAATLAAVVMAFSCMAVSASAAETATCNNHDDTAFSFAFSDWGRSNTTGRSKTDTSGTYIIANTICNGGFDVYVDGYDSNAGEWVDCTDKTTRGQPHLKTTNNPGLISQWVYEDGYRTARLGGYKWGSNRSATGLWSPDSAGSYRYLGSTT